MQKKPYALQFSHTDDYVIHQDFNNFPNDEITASFWVKTNATNAGTPFSYATQALGDTFTITNCTDFTMIVAGKHRRTGVSVNDGQWHHIAVTWRCSDGKLTLYKDGEEAHVSKVAQGRELANGGARHPLPDTTKQLLS